MQILLEFNARVQFNCLKLVNIEVKKNTSIHLSYRNLLLLSSFCPSPLFLFFSPTQISIISLFPKQKSFMYSHILDFIKIPLIVMIFNYQASTQFLLGLVLILLGHQVSLLGHQVSLLGRQVSLFGHQPIIIGLPEMFLLE